MPSDLHVHHIPQAVMAALGRPEGTFGVRMTATADGGPGPIQFSARERTKGAVFPGLLDLTRLQKWGAEQGVDRYVLSPWIDIQGYSLERSAALSWCGLLNDSLSTVAASIDGLALATVPLQDGGAAAAELERAVLERGMVGVQIGSNILGQNLDAPHLEPFWAAAERLGAAVVIHPVDLEAGSRFTTYALTFLLQNPFETAVAAACLIFGGVIDRHPDLKVLLVHGGGFLPYQMGRLKRAYESRADIRARVKAPPPDYLRWFWYDTVLSAPGPLRFLASEVGIDRVVLGSDYPYGFGDLTPLQSLAQAGLTQQEMAAVAEINPRRLLGR